VGQNTGGKVFVDVSTTSVGFTSSSDRRVHCGLGEETKVDFAEIRWPSGVVQRIESLEVGGIMRFEEVGENLSGAKGNEIEG
jgi:enediyne biosynthesis protein E4